MAGEANLIVNYIPQHMTEGELHSMFNSVGPVQSCRVMRDFKTNYSYGYGFVNYVRPEDAEKAISRLNGLEISNKRLKVSYARPSGEEIKGTNLYVTNLPRNFTEEDLDTLFEPYGTIVQKNLLLDKHTGMPRGVAFVRYNLKEEALSAITGLDNYQVPGSLERLSVRVAQEHGKQKAAYYAGWQAGLQGGFQSLRGGPGGMPRGPQMRGRGGPRGGMRGRASFNPRSMPRANFSPMSSHDFVQYPIRRPNGLGALRQEKAQQRYNPMFFGASNSNGYEDF